MTDVVIASGDNAHLVDALSAGPLATLKGAPVLLTQERALPAATAAEVKRLGATRAYVIGTVDVIGTAVETALRAAGVTTIVRLGGTDRYATAVAVSQEISPPGRALAMLVEEAGMVRDIQINVGKGRKKNAQVTDVVLPATADVPTPTLTLGGGTIPDLAHGQDVALNGSNTGRVGAAAAGESTYSATTTTITGNQTYSTNHTFNNVVFTGSIMITGGTQVFNCCSFTFAPTATGYPQVWVQGGTSTFNWCVFDSGQRGTQGYFETRNLYLGDQNAASPMSFTSMVVTAYRCRFSGCGNGVSMWKCAPTTTTLIKECLVTNMTQGGGAEPSHQDCFEIYTTSNVTLLRCRAYVDSAVPMTQSCVNITTDGGNDTTRRPITVDSCYMNGGIATILTRWYGQGPSTGPIYNVRFTNNRFGDYFVYSSLCDFNRMNVTKNLTYQANTDPTCIYWADSNVWDPTGADLGHTTGTSGDAILGLPHTAGATVTSANFTQNYPNSPEPWIWDDSPVYGWVGGGGGATAPGAPTIGTAVAGNANATVAWTDPASDGGSAITGYTVTPYIGATAQTASTYTVAETTLNGGVRSVVKGNLTNGTAYTFRVAATNAIGTGSQSGSSNSVTPTGTVVAPGAPTNPVATAGNASATITFTPGSNGGDPNVTYQALSSPGGLTGTSTSSPVTVTGLTNGTGYTFTVRGTNSAGPGQYSVPSNSVTPSASVMAGGDVTHGDQLTINHVGPWALQGVAFGSEVLLATPSAPSNGWGYTAGNLAEWSPAANAGTAYVYNNNPSNHGGIVPSGGLTIDGTFVPAGTLVTQFMDFRSYVGIYMQGETRKWLFRGCRMRGDGDPGNPGMFNDSGASSNFQIFMHYNEISGDGPNGSGGGAFNCHTGSGANHRFLRNYNAFGGTYYQPNSPGSSVIECFMERGLWSYGDLGPNGNGDNNTFHLNGISIDSPQAVLTFARNNITFESPDECDGSNGTAPGQPGYGAPGRQIIQTDCIALWNNWSGATNVQIVDNYLGGTGYPLYGGDTGNGTPANIKITGNKFTTRWWTNGGASGWPATQMPSNGSNGCVVSNNTWADDYGTGGNGDGTPLSARQYPNGDGPRRGTAISY